MINPRDITPLVSRLKNILAGSLNASVSHASAYSAEATAAKDLAVAAWVSSMSPAETLPAVDTTFHSSTTISAAAPMYDASKDCKRGAHRKQEKHCAWYNETINGAWLGERATEAAARAVPGAAKGDYFHNTTDAKFYKLNASSGTTEVTRGNRRERPSMIQTIYDTVGGNARAVHYDLDKPTPYGPAMWRVEDYTGKTIRAGVWKNGLHVVATSTGLYMQNYAAGRMATAETYTTSTTPAIVNAVCNAVAITTRANAPLDEFGIPKPVIAVGTDGGISFVVEDGNVWSLYNSGGTNYEKVTRVSFTKNNQLLANICYDVVNADAYRATLHDIPTANYTTNSYNSAAVKLSSTSTPAVLAGTADGSTGKIIATGDICTIGAGGGSAGGFQQYRLNTAIQANSWTNRITKDYFSGHLVGDIRRAWLANSDTADRGGKSKPLTATGSLTSAAVASGADLLGYSGWSGSIYRSEAYSSDLDFGTAAHGRMFWLKEASNSALETIFQRDSASTAQRVYAHITAAGYIVFGCDDNTTDRAATSSVAVDDGAWHLYWLRYDGAGGVYIYRDGSSTPIASATGAALLTLNNASASFYMGVDSATVNPLTNGTLALFRSFATDMSMAQWADIYQREQQLFQANAAFKLAGTSDAILAVGYDPDTDETHVLTSYGRSTYKGVLRTASEATPVGTPKAVSAARGALVQVGSTGADIYIPAVNLREDVIEPAEQPVIRSFEYTATSGQTAFPLPFGWRGCQERDALWQNGAKKRFGTGNAWTQPFDGFIYTPTLAVGATVSDWVSIEAERWL